MESLAACETGIIKVASTIQWINIHLASTLWMVNTNRHILHRKSKSRIAATYYLGFPGYQPKDLESASVQSCLVVRVVFIEMVPDFVKKSWSEFFIDFWVPKSEHGIPRLLFR